MQLLINRSGLGLFLLFLFFLSANFSHSQSFSRKERKLIQEANSSEKFYVLQSTVDNDLKILKKKSKQIDPKAKYVDILVSRMYETVTHPSQQGVGIAAPQIGINRQLILVQRFDKENHPFEAYFNPEIINYSENLQTYNEGCLSIPILRAKVNRSETIKVKYQNKEGVWFEEKISGFTAVIFQHEIDHLNGILFTERYSEQESLKK